MSLIIGGFGHGKNAMMGIVGYELNINVGYILFQFHFSGIKVR